MNCLLGCAHVIKNNAPICQIHFDYQDNGIDSLNIQNLRALSSFKDICNQ